jgi:ABC-type dipeptide/oligopeptide/nickel transport system ATPase component
MTPASDPLLSLSLSASYAGKAAILRDLVLEVRAGEILGLVGRSGSGKSTLALAIMKLLAPTCKLTGHIYYKGRNLLALRESELRKIRGREIALVLQSPAAALNPRLRIGTQLREAWRAHEPELEGIDAIRAALKSVSLASDDMFLRNYPAQVSVGQGQRVLIAMALLHRPGLIIADEPTSALDVITQEGILNLLKKCNQDFGATILLISHDLRALESMCDRVAILNDGQIVEAGSITEMLRSPKDAFSRRLAQHAGQ